MTPQPRRPSLVARLITDTAGATAIEYGLIAVLVTVGAVTLLGGTGRENAKALNRIDTALAAQDSPWAPDRPPAVAAAPQPPPQPGWAVPTVANPDVGPGSSNANGP